MLVDETRCCGLALKITTIPRFTLDITKIEPMDLFRSLQKSRERYFTRWDPILRESTLFAMDDTFHLGVTVDGWTATGETDRH